MTKKKSEGISETHKSKSKKRKGRKKTVNKLHEKKMKKKRGSHGVSAGLGGKVKKFDRYMKLKKVK